MDCTSESKQDLFCLAKRCYKDLTITSCRQCRSANCKVDYILKNTPLGVQRIKKDILKKKIENTQQLNSRSTLRGFEITSCFFSQNSLTKTGITHAMSANSLRISQTESCGWSGTNLAWSGHKIDSFTAWLSDVFSPHTEYHSFLFDLRDCLTSKDNTSLVWSSINPIIWGQLCLIP